MADDQNKLIELLNKLETIIQKQDSFSNEIQELKEELKEALTSSSQTSEKPLADYANDAQENKRIQSVETDTKKLAEPLVASSAPPQNQPPNASTNIKSNIEKFIGENLINKIGIAITVIGVGIGAKYSIEHDLISPLTRIIIGYLSGIGLLAVGMKLKQKYEAYSAVLVSGAIAILYFITYIAYSLYGLFPQLMAFGLMVIFTAFTIVAALNYNRMVIAIIGLVGAYAVPFLLSDGSGNVAMLFAYMAIINIGILIISFRKYWKPLYYSAFVFTWLIYLSWHLSEYTTEEHFGIALGFLSVFFLSFYVNFLAYKLIQKELFQKPDILLLLANSFLFYGLGFLVLDDHQIGSQILGLFTLANAIVHFVAGNIIYRQKLADQNVFYLIIGLVLVFITLAVPVQLDGNWVTLIWAGEAALLFWIGRTKQVKVYEFMSYPLMLLAAISLAEDWSYSYSNYYNEDMSFLFNVQFLSSLLFIAAFGFINFIHRSDRFQSPLVSQTKYLQLINYAIPGIFLVALYAAFRLEIANYWNQLFIESEISIKQDDGNGGEYETYIQNNSLPYFKVIWIINYSLIFFSLLTWVNILRLKDRELAFFNVVTNGVTLVVFLIQGLYMLSELRENYLYQALGEYYVIGPFHLGIRYLAIALIGLLVYSSYALRKTFYPNESKVVFDWVLYATVLWIASSELIHWMDISEFSQSYKLGLSILWGLYALFLIVIGLWKNKKHLRMGAFGLFGVTLVKLFFYDIAHMDTIAKTIVFVSLGILLLISSFLYNKYKHLISDESEN